MAMASSVFRSACVSILLMASASGVHALDLAIPETRTSSLRSVSQSSQVTQEPCQIETVESSAFALRSSPVGGTPCAPDPTPSPTPSPEPTPTVEPTPTPCPGCPPVLVITLNGVNADLDSPFHDIDQWLDIPIWPRYQIPIDPFHGIFQSCGAHPLKPGMLEEIRKWIEEWKAANPCGKVVIIGHSMGGITAWGLRNDGDCVFSLGPPLNACDETSRFWCQSMKDTCKAIEDGIEDWPGYIDWEDWGLPHTPFGDPDKNCDQLKEVEDKIRQCLSEAAPNCSEWQPNPGGYICGTIYHQMRDGGGDAPDQKVDRSNSAFYSELDATLEYLEHDTPSNMGFSAVVYPSSCSFTMPSVMSK